MVVDKSQPAKSKLLAFIQKILFGQSQVSFINPFSLYLYFALCFYLKGYLASYFGPELQKYTSFKVHHEEIRHVTANDLGILSLSSNELCFSARAGLRLFNLRSVTIKSRVPPLRWAKFCLLHALLASFHGFTNTNHMMQFLWLMWPLVTFIWTANKETFHS